MTEHFKLLQKLNDDFGGQIKYHSKLEDATRTQAPLIFSMECYYNDRIIRKFFSCEGSPLMFRFMKSFPENGRHFHEILSEERKIYFDIDSRRSEDETQECLVQLIKSITEEIKYKTGLDVDKSKDFIILSSSNDSKSSYHLIMPHFICKTIDDMKMFAQRVVANLEIDYQEMIDLGIYKFCQAFRVLGSSKIDDKTRILVPVQIPDPFLHDENIKQTTKDRILEFRNFESTLVSYKYYTHDAKHTICYDIQKSKKSNKGVVSDALPDIKVPDGLEFEKAIEYDSGTVFLYKNVSGYYCEYCKREHQHEHPFVYYNKKSKSYKFNCRRRNEDFIDI